jgi:hypothetical protein
VKFKKSKSKAVHVLFKAYPMVSLSCTVDPIWPDGTFNPWNKELQEHFLVCNIPPYTAFDLLGTEYVLSKIDGTRKTKDLGLCCIAFLQGNIMYLTTTEENLTSTVATPIIDTP